MPVRTARLAAGVHNTLNSFIQIYTCPQGRTAIVKDLRSSNAGTVATFVFWRADSGPAQTRLVSANVNPGDPSFAANCFVVLEPGDHISLFTSAAPIHYHLSGAELDGVAP